ncbi:major facilitator superfamily domain-containing protein [Penicillium cinerascens]|uniref:Major facilitator superfamily domain-containing protein n=1 Tax=Penicillium cinerascens TaxID=70096 RepID=A0A9W9MCL5_9EURO|nr:major facilitator superfamily domain-containing protein [Penicillium cinerascens]KAJ5195352.1 major facilitator superfamily domain-containing protein [Penicillium cinerascens]
MLERPSADDQATSGSAQLDSAEKEQEVHEYPGIHKRVLIMISLYLSIFLIILDQNVISTAIPRITDEFNSNDDIGWYGSAYLLTTCAFQLLMGKVYKFYPTKTLFLIGISIFEIGSAVCGSAPSSKAFILGRAVAGLGSSGLFSGVMVILFHTVPLQERPLWQGGLGGVFALGSVFGPLVGGTLTDKVTWRWCFYINLPIGAAAILVVFFILKLPHQKLDKPADSWIGKIMQLDPIGNLCFFPGIICLIVALQWGGTKYAWSSARIIVLLVVCAVLVIAFIGIQIWKQDAGTIPPRLLKQRSIAAATFYSFFYGAGLMVLTYYLPIWFQAIKGVSAIRSGIMLLPLMLMTVLGTVVSGIVISRTGYYTQFFLISSIIMPIGAGLISTFTPYTGTGKWVGYQILMGLGTGFGLQQPMNVVQTVLDRSDIATGSALVTFMRFLASAIFLPVAENIFLNTLVKKLTNIPGINPDDITGGGVIKLRQLASGKTLQMLLVDYNTAINNVTYMVVATSAITIFGSVFVEWHSLKARAEVQAGGAAKAEEDKATEVVERTESV